MSLIVTTESSYCIVNRLTIKGVSGDNSLSVFKIRWDESKVSAKMLAHCLKDLCRSKVLELIYSNEEGNSQ